MTEFPANDPVVKHLLIAQAHIPPTELTEAAGFTGTRGTISPRFDAFDDGLGTPVPLPDASGFRNAPIREVVAQKLNANAAYKTLFGGVFPAVQHGAPITPLMFAQAIAEFEFTLVRANAPIDKFARGQHDAMSNGEKRGALLFFSKAGCVACHAVAGPANEMFSDFKNRTVGLPQIAPFFGVGKSNVIYDGAGEDEDFGLEQVSGNAADRYRFRTSPLRNVSLQVAYFHNGAFTDLRDGMRFHMNAVRAAPRYNARAAGVAPDLRHRLGPIQPVLSVIDPLLADPLRLNEDEFEDLFRFVDNGLLDPRAKANTCARPCRPRCPAACSPWSSRAAGLSPFARSPVSP